MFDAVHSHLHCVGDPDGTDRVRALDDVAAASESRQRHEEMATKVRRVRRIVNADTTFRGENLRRIGGRETALARCLARRAGLDADADRMPVLAVAVCAAASRIGTDEWMLEDDPASTPGSGMSIGHLPASKLAWTSPAPQANADTGPALPSATLSAGGDPEVWAGLGLMPIWTCPPLRCGQTHAGTGVDLASRGPPVPAGPGLRCRSLVGT